ILDVTLEELYSNGYRIHTVMDRELQSTAEQLCADLNNFPPAAPDGTFAQVAVVAMDPRTGAVSTLVGGREYETALGFNRATQMRRQPGSIIKPFVSFSPALEELNMNAVTFLNDEPTDFNGYKPRNFGDSYNGRVTLRTALANSLNVPAVYLLNEAGVNVGFSYAQRAGLPLVEADRGLATALGGITQGVTPLEICNAYAGFANMGQRMQGYTIERIEHADGTVIYEHEPESTYFLSAETAFMMNDLLYYTADRGTAAIFNTVGTRLAGKTGTVDYMDIGNKDAWATGYNPEIVMTAWMGIDTPAPDRYMSTQVVGGRQPANLIARILTEYYIDRESPDWYTMPVGLTAVDIDMQTTEILGRPIVATANTPAAYRQTTYFRIGSVPTETTTFWDTPRAPADVAVSEDAEGVPIVTFTMPSTYVFYQLYRQVDDGAAVLLATVDGSQGKAAIRDVEAPHAMPSKYYVTPVHKYARPDGSKNVGLPSRPVIHVRSQSQIIIPVLPDDWAPNTPGLPPPSEDEFEDMEPGNDVPRTQIGDDLGGQNQ
ncbi:MAG: transglycosylase domain-containing protein, partial [Christensenellales bacterium]